MSFYLVDTIDIRNPKRGDTRWATQAVSEAQAINNVRYRIFGRRYHDTAYWSVEKPSVHNHN